MTKLEQFASNAILVPFQIGGRSREGWDCWGLVVCAYREVFGKTLKSWSDQYDRQLQFAEIHELISSEKIEWTQVDLPMPGDVGLYQVSRFLSHVSLVLDGGRMLHTEQHTGTMIERLDTPAWARRHVGYFRHN